MKTHFSPHFVVLAAMVGMAAISGRSEAAAYFWNPTGDPLPANYGGNGAWDTTTASWWDGTSPLIWPGAAHDATFAGQAGAVFLTEPVSANSLVFTADGYQILDGGNPLNVLTLAGPTINTNANTAMIGTILAGSAGLTKTGAGTLVLSQSNTYTGNTTLAGGVLQVGASGGIGGNPVVFSATSKLDLGAASHTLSDLRFTANGTGTVEGIGGSLGLTGATPFNPFGYTSGANATLDLKALTSFTYGSDGATTASNFIVGCASGGSATSTLNLHLSPATRISTGTGSLSIGVSGTGGTTSNTTPYSTVKVMLGQTTEFHSNAVNLATATTSSTLGFQAGLTEPSLTIRGADGTARASSLTIASVSSNYRPAIGMLDLTGVSAGGTGTAGTFDALVGNLVIGTAGGAQRPSTGTLLMGEGTLDATTVMIGQVTAAAQPTVTGTGTLSVTDGTLRAGTVTVGNRSGTLTNSVTGSLLLNGLATLQAQTLKAGTNGGATNPVTRNVTWNGGMLRNFDSSTDLTVTGLTVRVPVSADARVIQTDSGRKVLFGAGSGLSFGYDSSTFESGRVYAVGAVELNGASFQLVNSAASPGPLPPGTKLTLIDYAGGSLTGTFSGVPEGSDVIVNFQPFTIHYADGMCVTATAGVAAAENSYWNPTSDPLPENYGGSGVWNTTTASWWDGSSAHTWPGILHDAKFAGLPGIVTLAESVGVHNLLFTTDGYQITDGGNPSNVLTLDGGVIDAHEHNATIAVTIAGTNGLAKVGTGTLVLSRSNTYTGNTTISGGVLQTDANDALGSNPLLFPATSRLALGSTSQTVSDLRLTADGTATVDGTGGSLAITGGSEFNPFGYSLNAVATIDMRQLTTLAYGSDGALTASNFMIGRTPGEQGGNVMLHLADVSRVSTGTGSILIGTSGTGGTASDANPYSAAAVTLGQTTELHSNSITVGVSTSSGTMNFRTGLTTPSLTIRGADGIARASSLTIATANSNYRPAIGMLDLTGVSPGGTGTAGTLDALVGDLVIGTASGLQRAATGSLLMGQGTLDATNITIGQVTGATQPTLTGTGTLSVTNGTIKAGTLTLGNRTGTLTNGVTGNLLLNGTATLQAQTLKAGTNGGATNPVIRNFTWNGGVLRNLDSSTDLTVTGLTVRVPVSADARVIQADSGRKVLFDAGSGLSFGFDSSTSTSASVTAVGSVELSGVSLLLVDAAAAPAAVPVGTKFTLIDYSAGSLTGTFTGIPDGGTVAAGSQFFTIHYAEDMKVTATAQVADPYLSWIQSFTSLTNPADRTKDADPDHDGLNNLAEFALNSNPADATASGKTAGKIDFDGTSQVFAFTLPMRSDAEADPLDATGGELVFNKDGVTYRIQGSPDLQAWTDDVTEISPNDAFTGTLPVLDDGWEYRTFRGASTVLPGVRGFVRAKFESP